MLLLPLHDGGATRRLHAPLHYLRQKVLADAAVAARRRQRHFVPVAWLEPHYMQVWPQWLGAWLPAPPRPSRPAPAYGSGPADAVGGEASPGLHVARVLLQESVHVGTPVHCLLRAALAHHVVHAVGRPIVGARLEVGVEAGDGRPGSHVYPGRLVARRWRDSDRGGSARRGGELQRCGGRGPGGGPRGWGLMPECYHARHDGRA
mmetsp:Transcript_12776/g.32232  ORF Transcript_12776/g.32232 Transcript_12776/m.32232 type:complete len:205 (+) Transcript_12776:67-681(+)